MRMLAIECATEACSLALFDDGALIASRHEILGRGHAEHLIPLIASLPDKGKSALIRVSLGPGSFTGVRIGLAAARALGLAWQAEVAGYPTLALMARMAQAERFAGRDVLVCMAGGHGEWFVQSFDKGARATGALRSLAPRDAIAAHDEHAVIGSRAEAFVALRGSGISWQALPDARHAAAIAPHDLIATLTPLYGRDPDARLPR